MTRTTNFRTIEDVKRANKAIGHHWFDEDAMVFFDTKIEHPLVDGRWFVTSEHPRYSAARRYTVREALPDGQIEDVGEFQAYKNLGAAIAAIQKLPF